MKYNEKEFDEYFREYSVEPLVISDGDELGENFGEDYVLLTDNHIKALQEGKTLCMGNINCEEYICFVKKG
jgi:hypothetical protein